MESSPPVCGGRVQRSDLRGSMVWHVSQVGLHQDHHSPSHPGGSGDSCHVQLLYLPVSLYETVGAETPHGGINLEWHPLTRFTAGVNKIVGTRVSVPIK